jgi:alkyl hydroperoxide reductase subunit AhpC/predicted Ser/Thr protein kinase
MEMDQHREALQVARVGSRAPRFDLPCTRGGGAAVRAALDDYRDRWLIMLFYPRDFSLVCPTELTGLSARLAEFDRRDCDVLGISTDPLVTHEKWLAAPLTAGGLGELGFPLASDEDGSVSRAYGVYLPRQHMALRGLFIIDPNGVLQYKVVHNLSVGRSSEEVLRVLDALQTGGLCPENWARGEATIDPVKSLGPESVIGHYRFEAQVGTGTFGAVFRATDLTLERTVALKVLRSDAPGGTTALLAEARVAAALNHPNICTIHTVDVFDGVSMIVMEYLEGQALSKLLKRGGLPLERAAAIGAGIAEGMAAAHARGIVHGDLKPGNVMIDAADGVKIMDFGLARRRLPEVGSSESPSWDQETLQGLSGTPAYMSPEQSQGQPITPASDVFSLGLILYELIEGRRVISADNIVEVLRQLDEIDAQETALQVPEPFRGVTGAALVRDLAERTITMSEIGQRLSAHLACR